MKNSLERQRVALGFLSVALAILVGGIGFSVLFDQTDEEGGGGSLFRHRKWAVGGQDRAFEVGGGDMASGACPWEVGRGGLRACSRQAWWLRVKLG
ncbi:hypothetical protein RchiOBHm_Chr5g0031281 [Rosa chinensis]|uniref:Uncharacterized protein n=1 Tax=Rosa chinensis TaxID=74649 RepID=A0A2P6QA43_ROSCH|nr:hypothetical protein RchiOBHm_Chr5g0031281 [Rosa chinensis]